MHRTFNSLARVVRTIVATSILAALTLGCTDNTTGSGPQMSVRLVADHTSISSGSTFTLGVVFKPDPGWHIYWKNHGDSGLAPRFTWRSSPGLTIKEPLWPHPDRIPTGPLVTYGYDRGEVMIPFPATLDSRKHGSTVTAKLSTQWLVCKEECLPGKAELSLSLPVTDAQGAPSQDAALFESTFAAVPATLDKVSIAIEEQDDSLVVAIIPLEGRFLPSQAVFFPEDPGIISNAAPQQVAKDGDVLRLTLKRDKNRKDSVSRLRGVLVSEQGWSTAGTPRAVHIDTNPETKEAPTSRTTEVLPTEAGSNGADIGFFTALAFAFIGGFILNLMPCVFPVLSIKILSFMEHSKHNHTKIKIHGLLFSLGVVVSFWILAAAMLALRSGGEQLGWGFQLQSPLFVAAMIVVFFVLGILFLSEFAIGQTIQTLAGGARLPTSYIGSFLNGALATAVATPCTAPFMSSSLAATLTLPASLSFLIFTALGLGMSVPYLVLAARPSLLAFLPRPGEWMETLKQFMAFPLFATTVWLVRVFARQMGVSHSSITPVMNLLWALLFIAFGFWLFMRATHIRKRSLRIFFRLLGFSVCLFGVSTALPLDEPRTPYPTESGEVYTDSHGLTWLPYSDKKVAELTAQGKNVYIDFTAEWCITCQANKLVVFSSQTVRDLLVEKKVALVRADWTSHDQAITNALARYGRNGVPLNLIVRSGDAQDIVVLPNILTAGLVENELRQLK